MLGYTLNITLTLKGPILSHSTAAGEYGVDSPMARNAQNQYYLPGTLIKGRLRQAWDELRGIAGSAFSPPLSELLGEQTANDEAGNTAGTVLPSRGRLHFSDFINPDQAAGILHRISIDSQRGAVNKGALQVMEAPWQSGQTVIFTGKISYLATDPTEGDQIRRYVETGLRWITSLGAERTIGFGQLLRVAVTVPAPVSLAPVSVQTISAADRVDLAITPDSPFCIAKHRVSPNLFESEKIIPGGVIKGCIADTWRQILGEKSNTPVAAFNDPARQELKDNFDRLRVTHAFPSPADKPQRPVVAPLSLVKDSDKKLYDVALCEKPALLGAGNEKSAPAFAIDWKNFDDVNALFGWNWPKTELRVRTAIDRSTRRAKDQQLFAYEMIVPDGFVWYASVDLSRVDKSQRAKVSEQLQQLLSFGLRGLGKTKAWAGVIPQPAPVPPACASKSQPVNDLWIVTLQTPAILCDPSQLNEASGRDELWQQYLAAWHSLAGGSLAMTRYFAQQSLAGGFYIHRRFRSSASSDYYPFLLTSAGSVFVLQSVAGREAEAQSCINAWLSSGLPLPEWAVKGYARNGRNGDYWENCPYIRENGNGEIAVNLAIHRDLQPKGGEYDVIKPLAD